MNKKIVAQKVIDYIEEHLNEEIDLKTIAKNVGYSKFHLNRLFTAEVGCTIYHYLRARRLTTAAEKLIKTEKALIQIAHETGYTSQQAFSMAFKQVYDYSPKIYRERGIFSAKQEKISLLMITVGQKFSRITTKKARWAA